MIPHGEAITTILRNEGVRIFSVLAMCLVLFFAGLGMRPLWNQDEGMHAATQSISTTFSSSSMWAALCPRTTAIPPRPYPEFVPSAVGGHR